MIQPYYEYLMVIGTLTFAYVLQNSEFLRNLIISISVYSVVIMIFDFVQFHQKKMIQTFGYLALLPNPCLVEMQDMVCGTRVRPVGEYTTFGIMIKPCICILYIKFKCQPKAQPK